MRYLPLLLFAACASTPKPVEPTPAPIPTDLIQLETNPKPATFVVARGASQEVTVQSKLLSPAVKKIKISVSGSSGVEITPKDITLTGNTNTNLSVSVPLESTNDKPYFYINGQALDGNNNPVVSNGVTIKFQWTVPAPPPPQP